MNDSYGEKRQSTLIYTHTHTYIENVHSEKWRRGSKRQLQGEGMNERELKKGKQIPVVSLKQLLFTLLT